MKTGYTFSKRERLCGTMQVDRLFAEGDRRIAAFPIRLVWLLTDDTEGIRILISAPKRLFKHAVDRNRIKRQIREFYRTSSAPLKEVVESRHKGLLLAFLFTDSKLWETQQLNLRLDSALSKLVAELSNKSE
ncbi:MAG: ribonuclease P protein component [Bacteroidaceae bacterium]|nr:ribonuclease P protein component [Bacteroidaceae bacterium]